MTDGQKRILILLIMMVCIILVIAFGGEETVWEWGWMLR